MVLPLGLYEHYKGNEYELMAVGKMEKTQDEVAIYRSSEGNEYWVRPLKEFMADVTVKGKVMPRFRYLGA